MKIKVTFQDDGNGKGWNVWCGDDRQWQPIVGFEDESVVPGVDDACDADPVTFMNPEDYDGVEVV